MKDQQLSKSDYPIAEKRPDLVKGLRGKSLDDISLEAVKSGGAQMEDLRITPEALRQQAVISRDSGRSALAQNFDRAAEMASIPQDVIMQYYELLRPGRVRDKQVLLDAAQRLRDEFSAPVMAGFIEEAAEVYDRRGLLKFRY